MGSVLTIASQKGGAGKTTLCRVLLPLLAGRGLRIAAIDADPNRGLADWLGLYEGPAVTLRAEADERALARLPAELAADHDVVLIDTAGFGSRAMVVAIGAADAVLIPCQPDRGAVREAAQTAEWVTSLAASVRREIPFRVVMVGFDARRATDRYARAQLTDALALPLLASALADRTGYQALTWSGALPSTGPIRQEAEALAEELRMLGWLGRAAGAAAA
jgi:chromosome partitioning protein